MTASSSEIIFRKHFPSCLLFFLKKENVSLKKKKLNKSRRENETAALKGIGRSKTLALDKHDNGSVYFK